MHCNCNLPTATATATSDKQRNGMKGGTCVHAILLGCFFISSYILRGHDEGGNAPSKQIHDCADVCT